MEQIRAERHRGRRGRPPREVLPADPRDPEIIRAKALARAGRPRQQMTGHAVTAPQAADASGLAVPGRAMRVSPRLPGSPGEDHAPVRDGGARPPARA